LEAFSFGFAPDQQQVAGGGIDQASQQIRPPLSRPVLILAAAARMKR